MMADKSQSSALPSRAPLAVGALLGLLVLVAAVVVTQRFAITSDEGPQTQFVQSADSSSAPVASCVDRCKQLVGVGVDVSRGTCIVADLNGYGCAVSTNGKSLCDTAGSEPQVLLDTSCNLVGVVK